MLIKEDTFEHTAVVKTFLKPCSKGFRKHFHLYARLQIVRFVRSSGTCICIYFRGFVLHLPDSISVYCASRRTIQDAGKDHATISLADPNVYRYYPYVYGIIISLDKKHAFRLQSRLTLVGRAGFHLNSYRSTRAIRLRYNIRACKTRCFVHYVFYIVKRFYYYFFLQCYLLYVYFAVTRTTLHRSSRSLWE